MIMFAGEILAVAAAVLTATQAPATPMPVPFQVGERAVYTVKYFLASGSASLDVAGVDTVRGRHAYHFVFTFEGGVPGYHLRDTSQSWVDQSDFRTLRFHQDQVERGNTRKRRYEVFPERAMYTGDGGKTERPSVANPLDDVSFIYFIRTQTLKVGDTLEYHSYFKPESNPVRVAVLRREKGVETPAGKFDAIVVHPIIRTKGIFSEDGNALMWLSDDPAHRVIQIKTKLSIFTATMQLKSYRASSASPETPGKK
ncbi:MAG TPA: DUF3108 domain-containing protein [Gemmatimonadaceae bacterium]|nr:DUF3108 domain-containing protein [Gemmatimonadaceae bacterium]